MPKSPQIAPTIAAIPGGVFTKLAHRIAAIEGERYPLHIGDTWLEPMAGARMEDFTVAEHPGMHRYALPHGHPELLAAIEERYGVPADQVLATAGATGGLAAVAGLTVEPGDEVIVLAPFWPLIRGIVRTARATCVEVPFFDRDFEGDPAANIAPHITDRTVAIYVNSPHNPTGKVLDRGDLEAIVGLARDNDLWLWADEVYEHYAYQGEHISLRSLAPERVFAAHSFSKGYGMAGNRCGYVLGPEGAMKQLRKVGTHSFYSAPTAAQLAGAKVLRDGDGWVADARQRYQALGNAAAERLGVPAPQGGTFLFLDVAEHLDDRGITGFLEDCIDRNLILAPGVSCGEAYTTHVRVCFTSVAPELVERGIEQLAQLLGR